MQPVMAPAEVRTQGDDVLHVSWTGPDGRPRVARIARLIDDWDYVGHWWAREVRRHYRLLEVDDGRWLEAYREDGRWWVSRANG